MSAAATRRAGTLKIGTNRIIWLFVGSSSAAERVESVGKGEESGKKVRKLSNLGDGFRELNPGARRISTMLRLAHIMEYSKHKR